MIAHINYGGRVTDSVDEITLQTLVKSFINEKVVHTPD